MATTGAGAGDNAVTSQQQIKVAMLRLMSDLKGAQTDPPSVSVVLNIIFFVLFV